MVLESPYLLIISFSSTARNGIYITIIFVCKDNYHAISDHRGKGMGIDASEFTYKL